MDSGNVRRLHPRKIGDLTISLRRGQFLQSQFMDLHRNRLELYQIGIRHVAKEVYMSNHSSYLLPQRMGSDHVRLAVLYRGGEPLPPGGR